MCTLPKTYFLYVCICRKIFCLKHLFFMFVCVCGGGGEGQKLCNIQYFVFKISSEKQGTSICPYNIPIPITFHRLLLSFENSNKISFDLLTFIVKPQQGAGSFMVSRIQGAPDVFLYFRLHFSIARAQQSSQSFPEKARPTLVTHTLQTPDSPDHPSLPACWWVAPIQGDGIVGNQPDVICSLLSRGNFCCLFCSEVETCNILTNCLHL